MTEEIELFDRELARGSEKATNRRLLEIDLEFESANPKKVMGLLNKYKAAICPRILEGKYEVVLPEYYSKYWDLQKKLKERVEYWENKLTN
jgi:hypothetical protein